MASDISQYYMRLRKELIILYKALKNRSFSVFVPESAFMTAETLKNFESYPPRGGIEGLIEPTQRGCTIEMMAGIFKLDQDFNQLSFEDPLYAGPMIYGLVQDYIKKWIEIKRNSFGIKTIDIEELIDLERVARYVYPICVHADNIESIKRSNIITDPSATLFELLFSQLGNKSYQDSQSSFISYIDIYGEETGVDFKAENKYNIPMLNR